MDETIEDLPTDQVPVVVGQFVLAGKTRITVTKQPDGRWTVVGSD